MATNEATLEHLREIQDIVSIAIINVRRYQAHNGEMTTSGKNALLATVTTVPSALQHASNCSICNGWDGSAE